MLLLSCALAGVHSTREALPSRTIERPVVLPRGWTELQLTTVRGRATTGFEADGSRRPLEVPWTTWTTSASLEMGLAPGWSMFASLPFVVSQARTRQLGFSTSEIGTRLGIGRPAPHRSVAFELRGRLPLGFSGGSLESGRLPLTTGTGDLVLAGLARLGWNGLVLDARVEAWHRFGGTPRWTSERFRPGQRARISGSVRVQAGPLVLGPTGAFQADDAVRVEGQRVAGSAGWQLEGGFDLSLELTRGVMVRGALATVARGEDETWAWLPDVDPVRRTDLELGAVVRW